MRFVLEVWPDLDDDATPEELLAWTVESIRRNPELRWAIYDDSTVLADDVALSATEPDAYEEAGLGVMRAVMEVVSDRERVPTKMLDALDADDVTALYERYVGPACDRIEDDLLAPYPSDDAAAEAWS